ncbi:MAG: acyltransferase, partial [Clostridia bacterium]|nr:acyltransferase [Clostridia bacterium]
QTDRQTDADSLITRRERNTNFEWLRILAMIMIIFHHYCVHGQIDLTEMGFINKAIYYFFSSYGKLGVVIFVMLAGYFSCTSKFNLKRLMFLWLEVFFYSVLWYVVSCFIGIETFQIKKLLISFSVLLSSKYWFFTCYIALSIISPLLNIIIKNTTQKQHFIICIVGGLVYSFIASVRYGFLYGNELITFIYLYMVAAYIRLYDGKHSLRFDIVGLIVVFIAEWCIRLFNKYIQLPLSFSTFAIHSTTTLFIGVFLISICKKIKPHYSKFINYVAASTFGVYLIHDSMYRKVLWVDIFNNSAYAQKSFYLFALHMLITVIIVFISCVIIDIIRRELLEKQLSKLYDFCYQKIIKSKIHDAVKTLLDKLI